MGALYPLQGFVTHSAFDICQMSKTSGTDSCFMRLHEVNAENGIIPYQTQKGQWAEDEGESAELQRHTVCICRLELACPSVIWSIIIAVICMITIQDKKYFVILLSDNFLSVVCLWGHVYKSKIGFPVILRSKVKQFVLKSCRYLFNSRWHWMANTARDSQKNGSNAK